MPYEATLEFRKRVAVIGGGISGMGAAYHLADQCNVTMFEAAPALGGHARTVIAGRRADQPVDTGFIVFNHATYPQLTRLFEELSVPIAKSDMSFAASIDGGRFEYALKTLNTLFAQRSNLLRPRFIGMLNDILRFNRRAEALVADREQMTIGELLQALGTGDWFRDYYLLPFSGAIWSTPTRDILDFPAAAMLRFFRNHALLGVTGQHQWYTVRGGSREYIWRLEAALRDRAVEIRTGAPIEAVARLPGGVKIKAHGADWQVFDEVVFATHADDSLRLLSDASPAETAALGKIRYQPNRAVLHADARLMPQRRTCWAAWNYTEAQGVPRDRIGLSYWMNALQPIPVSDPLFVTLNPTQQIREDLIYDETTFRHPMYDLHMLEAQRAVSALNGTQGTWFCGAWMKNGFHEDGLSSAMEISEALLTRRQALAA